MSYLVDALKKAERERCAQQHGDLRAVAAGETVAARRIGARALLGLVVVLVVFNLGLLAYLLRSARAGAAAPVSAVAAATDKTAAGQPASRAKPEPASPNTPALAAARAGQATTRARESSRPRPPPRADAPAAKTIAGASPPAAVQGRGSARLFRVPAAAVHTGAADFSGSLPKITINGQLYSSVPGRSFILVRGRRYHEGERLASGPAIERIDRSGAVLNYRGRRFFVPGPG